MNNFILLNSFFIKIHSYTSLKSWKTMFVILLVSPLFIGCEKEAIIASKTEGTLNITYRTCAPGSSSISGGRIVFSDRAEFAKMQAFLECATPADVADWSDDFNLETAGKAFRAFYAAAADPNLTSSGYDNLKSDYNGKIKIINDSGDEEIAPLYRVYEELTNLAGEFQVENTVFKVTEDKFISIIDASLTNPSTVNNSSTTDTSNGVFVRTFATTAGGGCCANRDSETNEYASNPRRRLRTNYAVMDVSEVYEDFLNPGRFIFFPLLTAVAESRAQVRRCFLFICTWNCHNQTLSQDFDISFTHNADDWGITEPCVFSNSQGPLTNTCRVPRAQRFFGAEAWSVVGFRIPAPFQTCVTSVDLVCTNSTPPTPVIVDIECP